MQKPNSVSVVQFRKQRQKHNKNNEQTKVMG